jgi:glycerophosphoryl diester phosphodiesterase
MYRIIIVIIFTACLWISNTGISFGQITNNNSVENILKNFYNSTSSDVMVAAHRGDWRNAPENSIQAIKNSINMGVDIVEIDVRITKDSVLVLLHDETIDRTTTGKGAISEWTLDSLKVLYLRNGANHATHHKIPTLEEAMLEVKGKILVNLDKCSEYMDLAYIVLNKTGTVDQVIFKGTDDIDKVRRKYGDLLDRIVYMPVISEETPRLPGHVGNFINKYQPAAFEVIFTKDDSPIVDVIETIRKSDSRVWVNTLWGSLCGGHTDDLAVEDPDGAWGWVIEHGANIIQTDRPALLLEYLRERGLHD